MTRLNFSTRAAVAMGELLMRHRDVRGVRGARVATMAAGERRGARAIDQSVQIRHAQSRRTQVPHPVRTRRHTGAASGTAGSPATIKRCS